MYLNNHFAQFRRDLRLRSPGKVALLHITADKSYKLFVNGRYVCRGPARGYQSHWPFDSVDIRPYLKPGHNWISVEAYNPGISTFQYLHLTRAGLLCAPEGKELEAAWKAGGEDDDKGGSGVRDDVFNRTGERRSLLPGARDERQEHNQDDAESAEPAEDA